MWAAPEDSTVWITGPYRRACANADQVIKDLDLDDTGMRRTTISLRYAMVTGETTRHAGHADIVGELIDGSIGHCRDNHLAIDPNDADWWQEYASRMEASAPR